jgi:hypothetical protein
MAITLYISCLGSRTLPVDKHQAQTNGERFTKRRQRMNGQYRIALHDDLHQAL